jgi:hypothetical protein
MVSYMYAEQLHIQNSLILCGIKSKFALSIPIMCPRIGTKDKKKIINSYKKNRGKGGEELTL